MTEKINTRTIIDFLSGPAVKPRGSAGDRVRLLLTQPTQWVYQVFQWPAEIRDLKGEPMSVADFEYNAYPVGDNEIMVIFPGGKRLGAYLSTLNSSRSKAGLAIRCSQSHKGQPHKFDMPIGTQDRCFLMAGDFVLMDMRAANRIEHVSQGEVKKVAQQVESVLQAFNRWQASVNGVEQQAESTRARITKTEEQLASIPHRRAKLESKLERLERAAVKLNASPHHMAARSEKASSYSHALGAVDDAEEQGQELLVKLREKLTELEQPIPMPAELKPILKSK